VPKSICVNVYFGKADLATKIHRESNMKVLKLFVISPALVLVLSGCGINSITGLAKSPAYDLGYKTAKDLKDTTTSVNDYINNINSWASDATSTPSDAPSISGADSSSCAGLWKLVGLTSAIAGQNTMKNTPSNRSDFIQGCTDGFNS